MAQATLTLTDFLLARIAEDEAMVRSFDADPYRIFENHRGLPFRKSRSELRLRWYGLMQGRPYSEARDRLFAECEAKRQILLAHMPTGTTLVATADDMLGSNWQDAQPDSFEEITARDVNCMTCAGYPSAPCGTLKALALPYADHPDYRDEWRP